MAARGLIRVAVLRSLIFFAMSILVPVAVRALLLYKGGDGLSKHGRRH
ncbi:MAG: hypothetical protein MZV64_63770 [Ignavibacteriales bacterium]|nr:hypothetical protein [Ignavibacteriales bacterium]